MNIKTKLAIVAIIGATSLFGANLNDIENLVEKILNTKDTIVKEDLTMELNREIEKLNAQDAKKAQAIVDAKLTQVK